MEAPETILLVEDDALSARSVQRLLKRRSYQVVHVASCAEARALEGTFTRGVFDIELGDGDGVTLAAEMFASDRLRAVVFYTACALPDRVRDASRLGEVVLKGAPGPQLVDALRRAAPPLSASPPAYGEPSADKDRGASSG